MSDTLCREAVGALQVSLSQLSCYLANHDQLYAMGMRPRQILPPRVVEWLANHYGIDVDD